MKKITFMLLALLALSACRKHKPNALSLNDSDTVAIIKKMTGTHLWRGTYTKHNYADTTDITYEVSFVCSIERIGKDSVYFDSATFNTKTMGMVRLDTTQFQIIEFYRFYSYDKYTTEASMLSYRYLVDTIKYTGYYRTRNYTSELAIHCP